MKASLRGGALVVAVLVGITALAAVWLWQEIERVMRTPLALTAPRLFTIQPGSHLSQVARALEHEGWLVDYRLLVVRARLDGSAGSLQAGTYEIRPGDTLAKVVDRFVKGEVRIFLITFIEGCRFTDMRAVLARAPLVAQTLPGRSEAELMRELGIAEGSLEGLFFPSTYHYTAATPDIVILRRAYTRMQEILTRLWQDRDPDVPYNSPYEALIMASVIEKETGLASERAAIAGVFSRRLALGMKLQTDPSVIYGLGADFDGDLRRADLDRDTPYNTYVRHGLPPTPIAMPGASAIAAALHPAKGRALYFVAKGDGAHHFSDSLDEHNSAVRRYQMKAAR